MQGRPALRAGNPAVDRRLYRRRQQRLGCLRRPGLQPGQPQCRAQRQRAHAGLLAAAIGRGPTSSPRNCKRAPAWAAPSARPRLTPQPGAVHAITTNQQYWDQLQARAGRKLDLGLRWQADAPTWSRRCISAARATRGECLQQQTHGVFAEHRPDPRLWPATVGRPSPR